jgi:diaminopimelate epimerase
MSGELFYKMSGSGNDFVFLDGRSTSVGAWPPERIARVCARHTGVGADGLIILGSGSKPGRVTFTFFNSDGSPAPMCGNGALCATRLSVVLKLGGEDSGSGVELETGAGIVRGTAAPGDEERAELALPDVAEVQWPDIAPTQGEDRAGLAVVGVPHLVVPVRDLEIAGLMTRGRALRFHAAIAPAGANVSFVARVGAGWAMRTYERGVEGETLACATGAVACGAVLGASGAVTLPWSVRSRAGTRISVSGDLGSGGVILNPHVGGEARIVCRASLGPSF